MTKFLKRKKVTQTGNHIFFYVLEAYSRLFDFREHHSFLKLCLKLLSNHLALALAGGVATSILGRQAGPLRNLLFRLMDSTVPDEIQEVRI